MDSIELNFAHQGTGFWKWQSRFCCTGLPADNNYKCWGNTLFKKLEST